MSQTYELNKQINDLLPKVAQKYDLGEIFEEMYCPEWIAEHGGICHISEMDLDDGYDYPVMGSDQIRQILNALKDVLGKNPKYTLYVGLGDNWHATNSRNDIFASVPKTKSDALCAKWLDSLNPLIDTNPDQVLSELVDVLNQLLD
jgi:hypothetical protein